MKIKLFSIALLGFLPLAATAQTADEIVKKVLDARGGADKIKAVLSQRVTGRISFAPGMEGTFVVELKRPQKMHTEISVESQKIIRIYDGKGSGWVVNPFAENKDVQPMSAEDLKSISDEADFDGPLVDYKAKGNRIELAGKEDLDGKPAYRLKLTSQNGEIRFYLFDASSFLLLKWEGTRKIEGLKYAFKIDQDSPGTDIKQTLTAEKIEINPQIDESRFAKPTSPAPPAAAVPQERGRPRSSD